MGKPVPNTPRLPLSPSAGYVFDAFASYATRPDRRLIREVEAFLESLDRNRLVEPAYRRKIRLCVDSSDITARYVSHELESGDLFGWVIEHMKRSRRLVLFIGPESLRSKWISKELKWWLDHRSRGEILVAVSHGPDPSAVTAWPYPSECLEVDEVWSWCLSDLKIGQRLWFDLRGWRRFNSRAWPGRKRYVEERLRLAGALFEEPASSSDLIQSWRTGVRRRRRTFFLAGVLMLALGLVAADYITAHLQLSRAVIEVQRLIDVQQYEEAMKVAISRLPVHSDLPWRPGWSQPTVRSLLAKLAGAAQLSAYLGKLEGADAVSRVRFSSTGSRIVTASQDGRTTVWDAVTMSELASCDQAGVVDDKKKGKKSNLKWIRDASFGLDEDAVLSVGPFGNAWMWSAKGPACKDQDLVRLKGHTEDVWTGVFNHAGTLIVTTSDDGTVRIWNAKNGKESWQPTLPQSRLAREDTFTTDAEFSPDDGSILLSRSDGLIGIVDVDSRKFTPIQEPTGRIVWTVRYDHQGKRIVSASENGEVAIWGDKGTKLNLTRQPTSMRSAAFSPDGRFVVTAAIDGTARLLDSGTLAELFVFKGHDKPLSSAQFDPDGRRIATASDDRTTRIWDAATNIAPPSEHVSDYPIRFSAITPDGRNLVVAALDGWIRTYRLGMGGTPTKTDEWDGLSRATHEVGRIAGLAIGPEADPIMVVLDDGRIRSRSRDPKVSDWFRELEGRTYSAVAIGAGATTIALAPDGQATAGRGVEVWKLDSGEHWSFDNDSKIIRLEFNHDGTRLAAVSDRQTAKIWEIKQGRSTQLETQYGEIRSIHFSAEGSRLITASLDWAAHIWDAATGKEVRSLGRHSFDVNSARLSPQEDRVVTASSDRTVSVWDTETGALMLRFVLGIDANDAFFSQEGNHVLAVTEEGDIVVYDVAWTSGVGSSLKDRVCAKKLVGIDRDNQCTRRGPLSVQYWIQLWNHWTLPTVLLNSIRFLL